MPAWKSIVVVKCENGTKNCEDTAKELRKRAKNCDNSTKHCEDGAKKLRRRHEALRKRHELATKDYENGTKFADGSRICARPISGSAYVQIDTI